MKKAISFVSGLVLGLMAVLAGVSASALPTARFEQAVLNTVNPEAVRMSESDLAAFARDTMAYLRGETEAWEIDVPFEVPEDFVLHMAEVKGWVDVIRIVLPVGYLLGLGGLLIGRDRRAAKAGMLSLLGLIAALLLWAAVDFDSLWMVIHRLFIPGGIFPAGEPIMQLFPLRLFFGYVKPVAAGLAVMLGTAWLTVCYFNPKRRKEP